MKIFFRRGGAGWIGEKVIREASGETGMVELHASVIGRTRRGRIYPQSFSAILRSSDGRNQVSLLLNRRCASLSNVAVQIAQNGWAFELALLDREHER